MFNKANDKYTQAIRELDELKISSALAIHEQKCKVSKLFDKRQEVCTHPTTKLEDAYNYHHREEWTIVRCTVCEKQLEKY